MSYPNQPIQVRGGKKSMKLTKVKFKPLNPESNKCNIIVLFL